MHRLKFLENNSKNGEQKMSEKVRVLTRTMVNSLAKRKTKLRLLCLVSCVFLTSSSVMLLNTVIGEESSTTKIFTDPLVVQATDIGQNFTVNINVSSVVDLYAWQTGITFNPTVLECTDFYEGEFLKRSNETTLFVKHFKDMNNTAGIVYMRGCCILGPKPGISGSGQLAYATFRSVGIGVSDFHLTDILLLNGRTEDVEFEVEESFTVNLQGTNYGVKIANNLTGESNPTNPPLSGVFDTTFSSNEKKISFDARTVEDWFCQLIVPKVLLRCNAPSEWSIKVDGTPIYYTATENSTHTLLNFKHGKGNHAVEITGTEIGAPLVPSPPLLFVMAVVLLGLVALIVALIDLKKTRNVFGYKHTLGLR